MKTFTMSRGHDESGVSGTGVVLQGVVFDTGLTVIQWTVSPHSIGIYATYNNFRKVHIDSHPTNETEIVWHEVKE